MERSSRWRPHAAALLGYAAIAVVFTWPLAPNLGTHLTGPPAGDTGVYVWNQWVFQHEVLEQRSLPYFTDRIFSLGSRANLSLHNYTAFQNLIALPLVGWLGVIPTFNLVYLLMLLAVFLLGLLNAFVHAADAWASMPRGLVISVICMLLLLAATWLGLFTARHDDLRRVPA